MATKPEITTAIRAGIDRVEQTFGDMSDEQLNKQIHEDDGGWTAKQVLAHLAGRADTHQMMFQMAGGPPPEPPAGGFDVNHWNQQIVDARSDKSRDELLTEFRDAHERLIERVEALPEEDLGKSVTTPRGTSTLGDVLMGSGGNHSVAHSEEVKQSLGASGA